MKDLLLSDGFDLAIKNGDLVIGDSNVQHQNTLLITQPSSFKQSPDVGIGVENFLMDDDPVGLKNKVREEFTKDGQKVDFISYDTETGNLIYNANYSK